MRRAAPLVLAALAIAGCGTSGKDKTPAACLRGPAAFGDALRAAPGSVHFSDGTLISECLVPNQSAGDIGNLGVSLVKLSTDLNAKARANPAGPAPVQLGFLIGAITRGAGKTAGVHSELVGRLTVAATYSPGGRAPPAGLRPRYAKGYAAGKDHG